MISETAIVKNVELGEGVKIGDYSKVYGGAKIGEGTNIWYYCNVYGCEIGRNCIIGSYSEITDGTKIGNDVTISSHSFICNLVTIEDRAWVGHGVKTINDLYPPSMKRTGSNKHWKPTHIGKKVVIGSGAVLFPVIIGENAVIGAGSVVRKDVPAGQVWAGNPAKYICDTKDLKYENGEVVFPKLK